MPLPRRCYLRPVAVYVIIVFLYLKLSLELYFCYFGDIDGNNGKQDAQKNMALLRDMLSQKESEDDAPVVKNKNKGIFMDAKPTEEVKNIEMKLQAITAKKQHIHNASKTATGRINVYTYLDVCADYDNFNLYWNTLFPKQSHEGYFLSKLEDDGFIGETLSRRYLGHLHIYNSGYYSFLIESRGGADVVLFDKTISNETIIAKFGLLKEDIIKQDTSPTSIFKMTSKDIWLQSGNMYPIDITNSFFSYGSFALKFKRREEEEYKVIGSSHLSPLYENNSVNVLMPHHFMSDKKSKISEMLSKDSRLFFGKRTQISSRTLHLKLKSCSYSPSYLCFGKTVELYGGLATVVQDLIYPDDHIKFRKEDLKRKRILNESVAKMVATEVLNTINVANQSKYKLKKIVHIEENGEERQGKRYFVELDLTNKNNGIIYRFSEYFLKPSPTSKLCLPEGYQKWDHQATVYLICVVKNQSRWFSYLIQSLEDLIKRTNDQNLHLVTVDFNSTDANLRKMLEKSKLTFTFLQLSGKFSKVVGLNEGVRRVPSNDSIVFVMDLQLQIPDHIFDQVRKHTIKGKMTYCPVLMRLQCGEHPEYTKVEDSSWMDIGFGMISIYKSDWERIGGMNEKLFKYKWGGEDWEFVDRVVLERLEIVHNRIPGFYHIFHSTRGTWDGTKEF